jgi:hypothetical protein
MTSKKIDIIDSILVVVALLTHAGLIIQAVEKIWLAFVDFANTSPLL